MAIATPVREISIDRLLGSSRTGVGGATDGVEDGTWDGGVLVVLGVGAGVVAGGVAVTVGDVPQYSGLGSAPCVQMASLIMAV